MDQEIDILVLADEGLPEYTSEGASGADVRAHLEHSVTLLPGKTALIPTGLRFEIPKGYEIQIRPRSGLALKNQITVLNTPGTIDADFRGEVKIILINLGDKEFIITPGMRIAQLVVAPVVQARFTLAEELQDTIRGSGGFGHSGIH